MKEERNPELDQLWQWCNMSDVFKNENTPCVQQRGCEFVQYLLRPDMLGKVNAKNTREFLESALHWYRVETGDYK